MAARRGSLGEPPPSAPPSVPRFWSTVTFKRKIYPTFVKIGDQNPFIEIVELGDKEIFS
jgi:hypothetical protein